MIGKRSPELDLIRSWAAYRKIEVIEVAANGRFEDRMSKMLEEAYKLDHKGVYSSITSEEIELVYETLLKRNKPIYMPLLPFNQAEIEERLKMVTETEEAKNGR